MDNTQQNHSMALPRQSNSHIKKSYWDLKYNHIDCTKGEN